MDTQRTEPQSHRATEARRNDPCGHCTRPVGAVSMLGANGTKYHTGCWEAAIVIADRASTLKAAGGR